MGRQELIDKLFAKMSTDICTMAEYGDDEDALREELMDADDDILNTYADIFL